MTINTYVDIETEHSFYKKLNENDRKEIKEELKVLIEKRVAEKLKK